MASAPTSIPKDIREFRSYAKETRKLDAALHKLKKARAAANKENPKRELYDLQNRLVDQVYLNTVKKMIAQHWTVMNKAYTMARRGRHAKKYNPNTGFLRLQRIDEHFINYLRDPNVRLSPGSLGTPDPVKDYISYLWKEEPYGSAALMTTILALVIRENKLASVKRNVPIKNKPGESKEATWISADATMQKYLGRSAYPYLTGYIQEKIPQFERSSPTDPDYVGWGAFDRKFTQTILTNLRTRSNAESAEAKAMHQSRGLPPRPVLSAQEDAATKLSERALNALWLVIKNEEVRLASEGVKPKEYRYKYNWPQIAALTAAMLDSYGEPLDKILKPGSEVSGQQTYFTLEQWRQNVFNNATDYAKIVDRANQYLLNDMASLKTKYPALYYRARNDQAQQRLSQITSERRASEPKPKKKKPMKTQ